MIRSALRGLSTVLIVSGLLLLIDAGLTVTWQEPMSALYARFQQDSLSGELDELRDAELSPVDQRALSALPDDDSRLAFAARALDRRAKEGQPVGRILIPKIKLSKVFVDGTKTASLRKGPGRYPRTPLPGAPGTTAIAGHRTTYGAPFRRVDQLEKGDLISVEMPYGTFDYRVESTRIVKPSANWVTKRVDYDRLVLTACHPLYSATERIVVFARLTGSQPGGGLI